MRISICVGCLAIAIALAGTACAQQIEDYINAYTDGPNAENYLQPMPDLVSGVFNSLVNRNVDIDTGFHVYVGIVSAAGLVTKKMETFTGTTDGSFSPVTSATVPTIVGPSASVTVDGDGGTGYIFPGGLAADYLAMAFPQLQIGTLFGTEATVRYLAFDYNDDFEEIELFGFGLRHSISQYFNTNKNDLNLNVGIFLQRFTAQDVLDMNLTLISAQAGYRDGNLNYYGWVGYQSTDVDFTYDYYDGTTPSRVEVATQNDNSIIFGLGAGYRIPVLSIDAEINYSNHLSLSLGIGFMFGNRCRASTRYVSETN